MNIKRAFLYSIVIRGKIVSEGVCATGLLPDGELPNESIICKQLLQAAIDRGQVPQENGLLAEVTLMWVQEDMQNELLQTIEELVIEAPEGVEGIEVEMVKKGIRVGKVDAEVGQVGFRKQAEPQTDEEFLKSCGVMGLEA